MQGKGFYVGSIFPHLMELAPRPSSGAAEIIESVVNKAT